MNHNISQLEIDLVRLQMPQKPQMFNTVKTVTLDDMTRSSLSSQLGPLDSSYYYDGIHISNEQHVIVEDIRLAVNKDIINIDLNGLNEELRGFCNL